MLGYFRKLLWLAPKIIFETYLIIRSELENIQKRAAKAIKILKHLPSGASSLEKRLGSQ